MKQVYYKDLGLIEYGDAWQIQEALMKKGLDVKASWYNNAGTETTHTETIDNYLLLCNHAHVYTLGKSGHPENLLVNDTRLQQIGATFYKTNRGGDITYHGPGQLVGYPILDLEQFYTDLGKYMRNLEEVIIQTIAAFGIQAGRLQGATGVWLDADDANKARKICAMGVRSSRWITMHGFALNINADLQYFDNIVPCGISDKKVTSMHKELGQHVDEEEVKQVLKNCFETVFECSLVNDLVTQ
ncbi:lipoyl(octanoyl) transferase [Chitinophagaceae bacterium IBVUCB1]|nr:lipoyl(octanoyl) transferase [Chitinophagaceae bacterium IBVUCB1]